MKMNKILLLLIISFFSFGITFGKNEVFPIKIEQKIEEKGDSIVLKIKFVVSENWMVYDSIIGEGGPIPLTFDISTSTNVTLLKVNKPPQLHKKHDDIFEVDMLYFQEDVTYKFLFLKFNKTKPYSVSGFFEYMCCNLNSGLCLPPRTITINSKR